MEDTKIQWHPGFVAAMDMELKGNRKNLDFESEHNLNTKPLEIDLLIIKKEPYAEIQNEIGKIFRKHNIMEYKSPDDSLNIDTFYKVIGYACLYKSYGKTVDEIEEDDVTISLVREGKPEKLFQYFKNKGIKVEKPYNGIYYIYGILQFPIQIIVARELEQEKHMWIKALTSKMKKPDMEKLIETSEKVCNDNEYDRKLVESILEVTFNANIGLVEEMRGDVKMGEMMLKIMQPVILDLEQKAENRGKILGAIEVLRTFNSSDETKKIIMEKYNLTEKDAERYLSM